ncbi:hypothetical protein CR513_44202, partial [Mucuna pruriens]
MEVRGEAIVWTNFQSHFPRKHFLASTQNKKKELQLSIRMLQSRNVCLISTTNLVLRDEDAKGLRKD